MRYLPYAVIAALCMVGEVTCDLFLPKLLSQIVDEGVLQLLTLGSGAIALILKLGLMMMAVVIAGGLMGSLCNYFVQISAQNFGNAVRKRLFGKIMGLTFSEVDRIGTGALITRISNDVTAVERLLAMFSRGLVRTGFMMVGSILFMFSLNSDFGYIVLCSFPILLVVMMLCILRANPLFSRLQTELDALNTMLQEDLTGIRLVKAFVRECYELIRFRNGNLKLIKTQLKILFFFAFINPVVNSAVNLVIAVMLLEGGARVEDGSATPGAIMAAITYTSMLMNSMMMLLFLSQNISRGLICAGRISEVLNSEGVSEAGSLCSLDEMAPYALEFDSVSS